VYTCVSLLECRSATLAGVLDSVSVCVHANERC